MQELVDEVQRLQCLLEVQAGESLLWQEVADEVADDVQGLQSLLEVEAGEALLWQEKASWEND